MGNLGKFKKKVKKNSANTIILDEKTQAILMRLSINYANLLENKKYDKAFSMLNWAAQNKDLITLEAIDIMNLTMAEALNIDYKSFPLETRLTFFLENLHYVEQFFSLPCATEDLPEDNEEYERIKESFSDENELLLRQYLEKVDKSKKIN